LGEISQAAERRDSGIDAAFIGLRHRGRGLAVAGRRLHDRVPEFCES